MKERFIQKFKCAFAKTKVFGVEELLDFIQEEKEKLLDEMQAVCDKEENEGGRLIIQQFRNL